MADIDPNFEPDPADASQWGGTGRSPVEDPVAALVREFNGRYWVVNEAGKAIIYEPAHDPILNRRYHNKLGFADFDFEKLHLNRMVKVGDKILPAATVWLRHGTVDNTSVASHSIRAETGKIPKS